MGHAPNVHCFVLELALEVPRACAERKVANVLANVASVVPILLQFELEAVATDIPHPRLYPVVAIV